MWWWMILTGLCIITNVHGFSNGATENQCISMLPDHGSFGPQTSEPPFEVTYKWDQRNEPITVSLKSKSSQRFIGFMLEAREKGVNGGYPVGRFIPLDPQSTKLIRCNNSSAVSNSNNWDRTLIKVNWTADKNELDIFFRATFVHKYSKFWNEVDVDVVLHPDTTTVPPSTPTSTPVSTPASTPTIVPTSAPTSASTNTSTSVPTSTPISTPASTPASAPTSAPTSASTNTPTISTPTSTEVSTPTSTPTSTPVSTQTSTAVSIQTSIQISTTKPRTTEPSTTPPEKNTNKKYRQLATVMNDFIIPFLVVKEELPNILTISLTDSPLSCPIKITCSLLCMALEIPALVLFYVDVGFTDPLVVLVSVVIAINIIELIIVCLPIGPSHELKEICDLADKLCSVFHIICTTAAVYICVFKTEDNREYGQKWTRPLIVMTAYISWIFLFVIWLFILNVYKNTKLGIRQLGRSHSVKSRQQRKKELSACSVIVIAVSALFIVGTMFFTAAVIAGIFLE